LQDSQNKKLILEPRLVAVGPAAAYIGISATKLQSMVREGRAPTPRCIDRRRLWDRRDLDEFVNSLEYDGGDSAVRDSSWDD